MTARTGLTDVITELRTLSEVGTADYSLGAVSYWTDDQLQNILDRHAAELDFEQLRLVPERKAGGWQYKDYYIGRQWVEQTTGGTAIFKVMDYNGTNIGTALYTVDYNVGEVTFVADQGQGIPYYVTCVSYDVKASASEVWHKKATHYASAYDFSTDNHSVKREQLYTHAKEMAEYYEGISGEGATNLNLERRDDTCY